MRQIKKTEFSRAFPGRKSQGKKQRAQENDDFKASEVEVPVVDNEVFNVLQRTLK